MKRTIFALAASAVLLTACAGNESDTPPAADPESTSSAPAEPTQESVATGQSGSPRGGRIELADVDQRDPDAVADAVALTAYRYDPRVDNSPMDALRRATPWLTADYAEAANQPMPGGGGADWLALIKNDGYTSSTIEDASEADQPPDTADAAYRQRLLTVTTHDAGGEVTHTQTDVLWLVLSTDTGSQKWAVESINSSQNPTR